MISQSAKAIPPSATLAINSQAKKFKKAGFKVINFSVGQPDFPTPKNICQAAKKAIDRGFTKYTPASGIPELKEAVVKKFKKDNSLNYKPSQIIICAGGKQALFNLIFALIDEGDEVVLPTPAWVSYLEQIKICGGQPVFINAGGNFKITADQLKKAITKKTKLLILNSPSNPTGAVYNKKELQDLAQVIVDNDLLVISDEVYEKIVFAGQKHVSIASLGKEIFKRTVIVNALSKTYSMTGWRLGYAAGKEEIIAACGALQSHTTSNPCSISQKAALEALTGPQDSLKKMVNSFAKRRKVLVNRLKTIKGLETSLPQGAFYLFPKIKKIEPNSVKFCQKLLKKEKVATVPGSAFLAEGYIRLSYAVSLEDIKEGARRIKKFIKEEYNG